MPDQWSELWKFRTDCFYVALEVAPEATDPETLADAGRSDLLQGVKSGELQWCCYRVVVRLLSLPGDRGQIVGEAYHERCVAICPFDYRIDPVDRKKFYKLVLAACAAARRAIAFTPRLRERD
jgi:hypothetical protein